MELEVRVTDLYYRAHLSYDRLTSMTQHVRVKLLEYLGVSEKDLGDGRSGISVPDLKMVMLGEAAMGETIIFETGVVEIGTSSFRIAHRVKKKQGPLIALLEITIVAYDYSRKEAAPLSETLKESLRRISAH